MTFLGGKFAPVMGEPGDDGPIGDWWVYEDLHRPLTRLDTAVGYDRDEIKLEVITYEQMRPGSYDVPQRLADMDVNHVQSALCFPTFPRFCGQTFTEAKDRELGLLGVRAYNDWMVEEWCGPDAQGRLIPLTLIPLWDAESGRRRGPAQRGPRASGRSPSPRYPPHLGLPSDPHRRLGPVPRRLRRDRHRHRHAHRLQQPDAVHLRRRPARRRLHHHLRQLLLLDGRLADERQVRALPAA